MNPKLNTTAGMLAKMTLIAGMCPFLAGCAGVFVGGAATSAVVASDARTPGTFIEDQTIEMKALEAFKADEEIDSQAHINVVSYNQVVLVSGEAPTNELHDRVIAAVSRIAKVRHVHDEVQTAAPSSMVSRSSDSLVTAKVKTKLFTLKDFNAMRVKVVTENGVVYLMGLLARAEGDAVSKITSKVAGVQKVVKLFEHTN